MKIEICANSFRSAKNAEIAGADRIELCSELAVGGITPSFGLLKKVMQEISIPIHVLIRPRSGDFRFSDEEFQIMKENILLCKELNCAGIVSGILDTNQNIDMERTEGLVELSGPMRFTFHRAFDWVPDPLNSLKQLEEIGVDRILSSGQAQSAVEGLETLIACKQSAQTITMLPGGGIHQDNIRLFQKNGFTEVHLSATSQVKTIAQPTISMNSQKHFNETLLATSDIAIIKNCIQALHHEH